MEVNDESRVSENQLEKVQWLLWIRPLFFQQIRMQLLVLPWRVLQFRNLRTVECWFDLESIVNLIMILDRYRKPYPSVVTLSSKWGCRGNLFEVKSWRVTSRDDECDCKAAAGFSPWCRPLAGRDVLHSGSCCNWRNRVTPAPPPPTRSSSTEILTADCQPTLPRSQNILRRREHFSEGNLATESRLKGFA